jgi:hypothetical protein
MTPAQVVVTLAGIALAVAVNVYFFAPRRPRRRPDATKRPRAAS